MSGEANSNTNINTNRHRNNNSREDLEQGPCPEGFFLNQTSNKCQERPTPTDTETTTAEVLEQGPCPEGFFLNQTSNKCQERPTPIPTETAEEYFNEGLLQSKRENFTKAIEYFNKSLAINPNNTLALDKKGLALYNLSEDQGGHNLV